MSEQHKRTCHLESGKHQRGVCDVDDRIVCAGCTCKPVTAGNAEAVLTWTPLLIHEDAYKRIVEANEKLLAANTALHERVAALTKRCEEIVEIIPAVCCAHCAGQLEFRLSAALAGEKS